MDEIIDLARGLPTGQPAARVRKLRMAADPGEARSRYQLAGADCRLVAESTKKVLPISSAWGCPDLVTAALNCVR